MNMLAYSTRLLMFLALVTPARLLRAEDSLGLLSKPWFEARTPHFQTYSCGPTQAVAKLAARLEQFRVAYEALAGTQGVASPPIEVIALPTHDSLTHFVPLYQGQPAHLSGFFHRGSDENLIVLSLAESGAGSLETIFHEYAHLLLRRNQQFWPMWLNEGMADIYATFEVTGEHTVRIGKAQPFYLRILAERPLIPLTGLFAVTHDSPDYNERDRQGIFYAESWLLTHYLMIGNPAQRAHFAELTRLLKQGQVPAQAFTNAFHLPVSAMEIQLKHYLQQAHFESLALNVRANLLTAQPMTTHGIGPAETCFRLGDELLRIGRSEEAQTFFLQAAKLAPASPLPYEGMGLLEAERGNHREALENLRDALGHGSKNFLAEYACARERLILSAPAPDKYGRLNPETAGKIRAELEASLALMPQFAPAHHLLGFVDLLQGENLPSATQHLKEAIELEPENPSYLLTLAQVQLAEHEPGPAHNTLELLCYPYVDGKLRAHAQELLRGIEPPPR